MERIITLPNTTDDGGLVAVPFEDVRGVLTGWYSDSYSDDEPYVEICVNDIASWVEAGAHEYEYNGAGIYLGIEISVGKTSSVPVHELNYRDILAPRHVEQLTRSSLDYALNNIGKTFGLTEKTACLAYIQATMGMCAMRTACAAIDEAKDGSELANQFTSAWKHARSELMEKQDLLIAADLLPGRIVEAIRTGIGLTRKEWATTLNISESTAKNWENDHRPAPIGACTDMWKLWTAWITEQAATLGIPETEIKKEAGKPAILVPATTPLHAIRARLLILTGRRLTIDPSVDS